MACIAYPRLQNPLVGNGSLRKFHWGPQHCCLLGVELAGWLDRADLTDGHGFGTPRHAVHLTGGRTCRHARPQKDLVSGSTLACVQRDRSNYPVDGASTQSVPDSGERLPLQRRFRVQLPGPLLRHRRDGFRGRVGFCIYSCRITDGCLGDYWAAFCRALDSVGRGKLHFLRQRTGFPPYVPRDSPVETGTDTIKPSTGELLRVIDDRNPLRALHSRDQGSFGPARVVLFLYCYHPCVDAGCRPEGITS